MRLSLMVGVMAARLRVAVMVRLSGSGPGSREPGAGGRQAGPPCGSRLDLHVGHVTGRTESPRLGRRIGGVALECCAVGLLDGAQTVGYPGFAGGDSLAVLPAVGAFGQVLGVPLDFTEVG